MTQIKNVLINNSSEPTSEELGDEILSELDGGRRTRSSIPPSVGTPTSTVSTSRR